MTGTSSTLDRDRLEKVKHHPCGKITARCPACHEEGHDRTGNHLVEFASGKFSCIADPAHTNRIWELVGIRDDVDPRERRRWNREEKERRRRERDRVRKMERAKSALPSLIEKWKWSPDEVRDDSPTQVDEYAHKPSVFISSLFSPFDLVWSGEVFQSGEAHSDRWRTVSAWSETPAEKIGPMITPSTWKGGTFSRRRENIMEAPFIVLDFDSIPTTGRAPETPEEKKRLACESLAITRWLREKCDWSLSAILWTGSKSLHVWFEMPPEDHLEALRESMTALGVDPSLIGRPEHPSRLPGMTHEKTGGLSRTLWLQR
ncbi:MAG: hypothetical protein P1U58_20285 [Verrucomicrobiales bacterium]|nr:hypothetical protein [Verrucomicrobiales bacterium]